MIIELTEGKDPRKYSFLIIFTSLEQLIEINKSKQILLQL